LERLRRSDNECTGDIVDDVTNNSVKKMKLELGKLVITRRGAVNVIALAAAASCLFRFRTFNMELVVGTKSGGNYIQIWIIICKFNHIHKWAIFLMNQFCKVTTHV
jgi:hypothetical protein